MGDQSSVEQQMALFRQASRLSRREVLRRGLALGLSMPIIGYLLAACGGSEDNNGTTSAATAETGGTTPTTGSSGTMATSTSTGTTATATPASRTGVTGDTPWYVDQAPGPPVSGGTINYLLYEDPDSLNPVIGQTGMATQVSTAILEGLAETNPDGSWAPILAAEIPTLENGGVSQDLLTVTWKLREGTVWHDGSPFTSDDVKFTWEAASSADGGSALVSQYDKIESIETPDDHTAVVKYKTFNVAFTDQFPWIIPRAATGDVADMQNWDFNRAPVGTGPFRFKEWAAGDHIILVKNDSYREEGKPYLDGINFLVIPSEESRAAQMLQGDAQVMIWPGETSEAEFEKSDVAKVRLAPGIWTASFYFNLSKPFDGDPGPNPPHPLFGDVNVREAIGYAINRKRIVTDVLPNVVGQDSQLDVGWIQAKVKPWEYDPEKAKQLLDQAGWPLEGDVRVAKGAQFADDGTKFEFVCNGYTNFKPNELAQLAIQEDLAKVGLNMKIENQDFAIIFGTWEDKAPRMTGDWDTFYYDSGFFIEPHESIRRRYASDQIPSAKNPSGQNFWRWNRKDVDGWISEAGSTPDREKRRAAYQKIADAMREDVLNIPVLNFTEGSAYSTKLHGFTVSTWEYSTWDCENWWLEQ